MNCLGFKIWRSGVKEGREKMWKCIPLAVVGTRLSLRGYRQPKPGVWYSLKLSASPTLFQYSRIRKTVESRWTSPSDNAFDPFSSGE